MPCSGTSGEIAGVAPSPLRGASPLPLPMDTHAEFKERVLTWFQNALNRHGVDRKQLAKRYGSSRQNIDEILRGSDVRLTTLHDLAKAAGFDVVIYFTPKSDGDRGDSQLPT
jgi:hypothetical protein